MTVAPSAFSLYPWVEAQLGRPAARRWFELSVEVSEVRTAGSIDEVSKRLRAAAAEDPDSPVSPALLLWVAELAGRRARYREAVESFDAVLRATQNAPPFLGQVTFRPTALHHKAHVQRSLGDLDGALATLGELAAHGPSSAPLFEAGGLAEDAGRFDSAAQFYQQAAATQRGPRTDDPGQLALRGLDRIADIETVFAPSARGIAHLLATALATGNAADLERLASKSHLQIGPAGGHFQFEEPEMLGRLCADLAGSQIVVGDVLSGAGDKRYLTTSGWRGEWFRGRVGFLLLRSGRGWQWTGVVLLEPLERWLEHWTLTEKQTNQRLPIQLLAPWPAGRCFEAGGLARFIRDSALILAGGPFAPLILRRRSRTRCGFGPRGFYYNFATHRGEDAFAIDFTSYQRGDPFDNQSGGTPVLAPLDGMVVSACGGATTGSSAFPNIVEILHADPTTGAPRFLSRYLHLAGPTLLNVIAGMAVLTGDRLGLMNDTGNSSLSHLHFSVHDQNVPFPGAGTTFCSGVTRGASVRPMPMEGRDLEDNDNGRCICSTNVERPTVGITLPPGCLAALRNLLMPGP